MTPAIDLIASCPCGFLLEIQIATETERTPQEVMLLVSVGEHALRCKGPLTVEKRRAPTTAPATTNAPKDPTIRPSPRVLSHEEVDAILERNAKHRHEVHAAVRAGLHAPTVSSLKLRAGTGASPETTPPKRGPAIPDDSDTALMHAMQGGVPPTVSKCACPCPAHGTERTCAACGHTLRAHTAPVGLRPSCTAEVTIDTGHGPQTDTCGCPVFVDAIPDEDVEASPFTPEARASTDPETQAAIADWEARRRGEYPPIPAAPMHPQSAIDVPLADVCVCYPPPRWQLDSYPGRCPQCRKVTRKAFAEQQQRMARMARTAPFTVADLSGAARAFLTEEECDAMDAVFGGGARADEERLRAFAARATERRDAARGTTAACPECDGMRVIAGHRLGRFCPPGHELKSIPCPRCDGDALTAYIAANTARPKSGADGCAACPHNRGAHLAGPAGSASPCSAEGCACIDFVEPGAPASGTR